MTEHAPKEEIALDPKWEKCQKLERALAIAKAEIGGLEAYVMRLEKKLEAIGEIL